MKILISGAGIAGLTLAYWLHKNGHEPVVIDKAPDIRTEGYMIDFGGTGWDVANRMGLIEALGRRQYHSDLIRYKNGAGQTTAQITLSKLYKVAKVEGKFMALNRRDIVRVLYEAVEADLSIRFNTTVQTVCQSADSVAVTFNDGSTEQFDMLVGADGIHSQIRGLAFDQEAAFANYLGYRFAIFITPSLDYDLEKAYAMYVEPGYQVSVFPLSENEWMIFVINRSADSHIPPQAERGAWIRGILADAQWIVPDILRQLADDTYIFMDTVTQVRMPRWSNNRVVLIGDAAYCPTLVSGQGASLAMAGAYFLAQELEKTTDLAQAFQHYEAHLRPHVEKTQAAARTFAPNFVPQSHLRITLVNWVLRMIDLPLINRVVGKQFSAESIIRPA